MKIIYPPKSEEEVLKPAKEEATPKEVKEDVISKAEYRVIHLCGCSCPPHKNC